MGDQEHSGSGLRTLTVPATQTAQPRHGVGPSPERKPTILVVDGDDLSRRLLKAVLKTESCHILETGRAREALSLLEQEVVDLIILDLMVPGMSGPEFCRSVKSDRRTQLIPILMITSIQGVENQVTGIDSGADEFLLKPLHPAVVRARIRCMLRNKAAIDSLEEAESILFALAQAIEQRDQYTAGHCERLARYSVSLGMALGLSRQQLLALHRGGYLHDIGKVAIPDAILHKNGRLTDDEWTVMKLHPVKGEEICRGMKSLKPVLPIIRYHHERWDGGGYPDGLRGEDIPLSARILQVADIYDALTTARPYKPALDSEKAFQVLDEEASRGWRDPELVFLFKQLHGTAISDGTDAPFLQRPQLELMNQALHGSPGGFAPK